MNIFKQFCLYCELKELLELDKLPQPTERTEPHRLTYSIIYSIELPDLRIKSFMDIDNRTDKVAVRLSIVNNENKLKNAPFYSINRGWLAQRVFHIMQQKYNQKVK